MRINPYYDGPTLGPAPKPPPPTEMSPPTPLPGDMYLPDENVSGKGGQNTAQPTFTTSEGLPTGGGRPMGPLEPYMADDTVPLGKGGNNPSFYQQPQNNPYQSGQYYNRQPDVFGRPSYMYNQQSFMPQQPYSMGSPYQQPMGKGGQGYNQRMPYGNPYSNSFGGGFNMPQTPSYQQPMKGGRPQQFQPQIGTGPVNPMRAMTDPSYRFSDATSDSDARDFGGFAAYGGTNPGAATDNLNRPPTDRNIPQYQQQGMKGGSSPSKGGSGYR